MNKTTDLYTIIARIVKAWPDSYGCSRMNTFAVIHNQAQINTANLAKDAKYQEAEYFFSRDWDYQGNQESLLNYSYPAIFLIEQSPSFEVVRPDRMLTLTVNLIFADLSTQKDSEVTGTCQQRTNEQITSDLLEAAEIFFNQLAGFCYAEIELTGGGGTVFEWHSHKHLANLLQLGNIVRYRVDDDTNKHIHFMKPLTGSMAMDGVDGLVLIRVPMTITFSGCRKPSFDYEDPGTIDMTTPLPDTDRTRV